MTIDIVDDIINQYIVGYFKKHGFYPKVVLVCDSLYNKIPLVDLVKVKQIYGTVIHNENETMECQAKNLEREV